MARTLRAIGIVILAVGAWALIATKLGWIPEGIVDRGFLPAVRVGVASLGAGLVLAVLAPIARLVRRSRCARCRAVIERGQTYCADHLRETVHEARDRQHRAI